MADWYWCLRHDTVESDDGCAAQFRLGPYATQEDARNWREHTDARDDRWEADDARWEGRPPDRSR